MGFNGDLAQQQFWEADVRFRSKADIALGSRHVRSSSESGHSTPALIYSFSERRIVVRRS